MLNPIVYSAIHTIEHSQEMHAILLCNLASRQYRDVLLYMLCKIRNNSFVVSRKKMLYWRLIAKIGTLNEELALDLAGMIDWSGAVICFRARPFLGLIIKLDWSDKQWHPYRDIIKDCVESDTYYSADAN